MSSSDSAEPVIKTCRTLQISHSSFLPPSIPFSLTLPLSLSLSAHAATACLLFHPSIERQDKNRSNFSPIQSLASRAGSRDTRSTVSECLWFHILGCEKMSGWVVSDNDNVCLSVFFSVQSSSSLSLSPTYPFSTFLSFCPLPASSCRQSMQSSAVRGAEDRGFMVFSPEEHLIQGQRVTFN